MRNLKILFFVFTLASLAACKKDEDNSKEMSHVNIHMTDAPALYTAVNVDVQSVVLVRADGNEIVLTDVKTGNYNLLDLTNGKEVEIADGDVEAGAVSQIRLVLGPNNSLVTDGITYDLKVPSGSESGLKILVNKTLVAGTTYSFLLDFDADKSIVQTGDGKYMLKPVIRIVDNATMGTVKGVIMPADISVSKVTLTSVANADVSYSTYTDDEGAFMVQAVTPGSYNVTITPVAGYQVKVINDVSVSANNNTDIGTITLLNI